MTNQLVTEVNSLATTKAQQKAVHKYVKSNYDRLELTVPKGRKDEIKAFAAAQGETVNSFINSLINEAMGVNKTDESEGR